MSPAGDATTYRVTVLERFEVARRTMAFRFERPSGFSFKPGQFIDLTLDDLPEKDPEGNVRSLSLASGPQEETLLIATRMRETPFKRALGELPTGSSVTLEGPFGSFVLEEGDRPAVFLTGGIGVTPFRSMLLAAARTKAPRRLFLFYSNRTPEDAAFLEELRSVTRDHAAMSLEATMTKPEQSQRPWKGRTGYLTWEMVAPVLQGVGAPLFYLAGPPGMVRGLRDMLREADIPARDVRAEDFTGY